jgi:nicotinamide riboside kinase
MKIVNFLGGPCSGKSTLCAGLFYKMKISIHDYNVEYVHEYAKELTWERRLDCLADQFYVTANQNHMFERCRGKVDWILTDTSLLLGLIYAPESYHKSYEPFLVDVFNSYDNINIFVNRPENYQEEGRNQSRSQAVEIDNIILDLLDRLKIPYMEVDCDIDRHELLERILQY